MAELLAPYAGQDGEWKDRLRSIMEWADHGNSRHFFELFLQLIDNGTLDQARGPLAANSTFWSMLYGLAQARLDWLPEVEAHWLRRRLAVLQQEQSDGQEMRWRDLANHDSFGAQLLHAAVEKHPEVFAQHVLPVIVEISEAALYRDAAGYASV